MISLSPISLKHWQGNDLEHLRYEYDLKPEDTVVDLGSYQGRFKNKIIEKYGCKVIEFDPLVNHAAWITDGQIWMGGAYYYTHAVLGDREVEGRLYPCVDIVKALQDVPEIALMKINIEGCEYMVLEHLIKNGLIQRIKNIQVQFHLVEDMEPDSETYYEKIAIELTKTHKLSWQYKFCWENWERND